MDKIKAAVLIELDEHQKEELEAFTDYFMNQFAKK